MSPNHDDELLAGLDPVCGVLEQVVHSNVQLVLIRQGQPVTAAELRQLGQQVGMDGRDLAHVTRVVRQPRAQVVRHSGFFQAAGRLRS